MNNQTLDDLVVISQQKQTFRVNSHTEYGEPQIWISFSDGTSLEITHETNELKPKDYFYTMRHHCSENDFDNDKYSDTIGIINSFKYSTLDDLKKGLCIFLNKMAQNDISIIK